MVTVEDSLYLVVDTALSLSQVVNYTRVFHEHKGSPMLTNSIAIHVIALYIDEQGGVSSLIKVVTSDVCLY